MLDDAIDQMKGILRGSEENALATFNASHRAIKEATKRGIELEQALSEPRLRDLERARQALGTAWPFLRQEADIGDDLRAKASALEDLLARETFYRELPAIEQHTRAIEAEYERRYEEALDARVRTYGKAFDELIKTPGWMEIDEDQQRRIANPIKRGMTRNEQSIPIPQLRSERDACESRLRAAIAEVHHVVEGERVVAVNLGSYFSGGVETEEQLDAALEGVREECARLIGAGKKIIVH
jgi:hypothetical protein